MRALDRGYSSEIDVFEDPSWSDIIRLFRDASIYQTWPYEAVRSRGRRTGHFVLRHDGEIVAAAQVRLLTIPLFRIGIAYIRWGPLWRPCGADSTVETFRQAVRGLRNEYVCKRGLLLRLVPRIFSDESEVFSTILQEEGFSEVAKARRDRTILLDLNRSLDDLRRGLKSGWRRQLNRAEKNALEVLEGSGDDFFERFVAIYREMVARKQFIEPNDINEFRRIQRQLPEFFKMRIMLCLSQGIVCAGLICGALGDTGVYLFGATSNSGMESRGSYLLHWRLIEWLKQTHMSCYDLHGIDPVRNPGGYQFKDGLCGENGKDVSFLGTFDSCNNPLSLGCVTCLDTIRSAYRDARRIPRRLAERRETSA